MQSKVTIVSLTQILNWIDGLCILNDCKNNFLDTVFFVIVVVESISKHAIWRALNTIYLLFACVHICPREWTRVLRRIWVRERERVEGGVDLCFFCFNLFIYFSLSVRLIFVIVRENITESLFVCFFSAWWFFFLLQST